MIEVRADTNTMSSDDGYKPAQPRLACLEIRGGNHEARYAAELPGLAAWVSCRPLRPSDEGGDLYYLSLCSHGEIARVTLADVAGHGDVVSGAAVRLRDALREHSDEWDLSLLIRKLNDTFLTGSGVPLEYATAFVIGYYGRTGELVFTNAGHPAPLWYRSTTCNWTLLQESTPWTKSIDDLPLGLIPGTQYSQTAVELAYGDLLLLYTDGVSEATDAQGTQLGQKRLLEMVSRGPIESPELTGEAFRLALDNYRGGTPAIDDETFIVLRRTSVSQQDVSRQNLSQQDGERAS